jgi:SPP1 family predicted phage head-tail adaptor
MRAGSLDRTITIEALTVAVDDAGTTAETWTTFATVRAQIIAASTDEFFRGYGEGGNTVVAFRTRYLEGVTTDHRVAYDGRSLNIREVKEIGRRRGLELRCEEVRT